MAFVIRDAVENDAELILDFIYALSSHTESQKYVLTNVEILKKHGFGKDRKFGTLLAEIDGKPVGYLCYQWDYSIWAGSHFMFIQNVYVLEQHRRSGIGAALMEEAKVVCKNNGLGHMKWEIDTDNTGAIEFYEKTGATVAYRRIGSCTVT